MSVEQFSQARQIIEKIQDTIKKNKTILKTVKDEFIPLQELERDIPDAQFPYVVVVIGDTEPPRSPGVIGTDADYLLPVTISCWVIRQKHLEIEMDNALKELRDIIESPTNTSWGGLAIQTFKPTYLRIGPWNTTGRTPSRIFGYFQIDFSVWYRYVSGSS
jgi:hypothetical protein